MIQKLSRWMHTILLILAGTASAAPALPASTVATNAVRDALAVTTPANATQTAADQTRAAAIAQVASSTSLLAQSAIRGRTAIVHATAYNSLAGQTDSTPFITATGTRTRPGVVALSRDLLRQFPYGSKIMIEDLSGRGNSLFAGRVFYVEDTMNARYTGRIDIWMPTRSQAINFGTRTLRITAVR